MNFEPLRKKKRGVILSTDIGPDCDDVGAIALLWSYADELGFPVLGICNCTSNENGSRTIYALNKFCTHANTPIGAYTGRGLFEAEESSRYNGEIARRFGAGAPEAEPHVAFYRRLLSEAEDDSVIIITIGMFTDLADLLDSGADGYSPLNGVELVRKKVHAAVSMATRYPAGREFNIRFAPEAARRVLDGFPKDIYIDDFFIGAPIKTGFAPSLATRLKDDPIFESYRLYTAPWGGSCQNASFDLLAVQFAAEGFGTYFSEGPRGRVRFYNEDPEKYDAEDATEFIEDADGRLVILRKACSDGELKAELDRRIATYSDIKDNGRTDT